MLKNAEYIYNNIIIADEINTTKKYCKKAQVGVDLSAKAIYKVKGEAIILTDKTYVPEYIEIKPKKLKIKDKESEFWFLPKGGYIVELNEGTNFGPNDTGYIIQRSSLNRSNITLLSCVFDPGFTTKDKDRINTISVRIIVENEKGIYLEKNTRVGQMILWENEDCDLYNGQFQKGLTQSNLI